MTAFIRFAFVASALRYGIAIHAFCAMSTHLHYVVTDPHGRLPLFMAMFHRAVTLGVQRIRKWDGAVWNSSQASAIKLRTRQAIVEKIAYTLANPVEAGLVRHAHEWPGVITTVSDIGVHTVSAQIPSQWFRSDDLSWPLEASIAVSLPPSISANDAQAFRDDIERELHRLEKSTHAIIPAHKVLGAKRAAAIDPEKRITSHEPARQLNPTFAVGRGNHEALIKAKQEVRDFRQKYRQAFDAWRAGNRSVVFPAGTYMMRVVHGAIVAGSKIPKRKEDFGLVGTRRSQRISSSRMNE
jgi:putative transposase